MSGIKWAVGVAAVAACSSMLPALDLLMGGAARTASRAGEWRALLQLWGGRLAGRAGSRPAVAEVEACVFVAALLAT